MWPAIKGRAGMARGHASVQVQATGSDGGAEARVGVGCLPTCNIAFCGFPSHEITERSPLRPSPVSVPFLCAETVKSSRGVAFLRRVQYVASTSNPRQKGLI